MHCKRAESLIKRVWRDTSRYRCSRLNIVVQQVYSGKVVYLHGLGGLERCRAKTSRKRNPAECLRRWFWSHDAKQKVGRGLVKSRSVGCLQEFNNQLLLLHDFYLNKLNVTQPCHCHTWGLFTFHNSDIYVASCFIIRPLCFALGLVHRCIYTALRGIGYCYINAEKKKKIRTIKGGI